LRLRLRIKEKQERLGDEGDEMSKERLRRRDAWCMDAWLTTFNHEIVQSSISYFSTSTLNFFLNPGINLNLRKNSRLHTVAWDLN